MLLEEQMSEMFKMLDTIYYFYYTSTITGHWLFLIVLIYSGKGQAEFTELRSSVCPYHLSLQNNLLNVNSK